MTGIIFDVDGTLWDSTEQVAVSWNRCLRETTELDVVLTGARLGKEFGKPLPEIIRNLFPDLPEKEREILGEKLYRYENAWISKAPCILYEGMKETIAALSMQYPLYIVSNCQSGYIEAFLENTGLQEYFRDHACPGDTGLLKADNIRIMMERNRLDHAVYVGDTQGDADACREAGVPMIYCAYGLGEVTGDYATIHRFPELLAIDFENMKI